MQSKALFITEFYSYFTCFLNYLINYYNHLISHTCGNWLKTKVKKSVYQIIDLYLYCLLVKLWKDTDQYIT
jgi:hypothetical protein